MLDKKKESPPLPELASSTIIQILKTPSKKKNMRQELDNRRICIPPNKSHPFSLCAVLIFECEQKKRVKVYTGLYNDMSLICKE